MENRKTISSIIGSHLKNLRLNAGYSQAELGKRLNVDGTYVGLIERAKRLPSVEVIEAYANTFEVPIQDLLNLREMTIFETVEMLGNDTPPAIKNERNMIVHSMRKLDPKSDFEIREDGTNYSADSAQKIEVKIIIDKNGDVRIGDEYIDINDLPAYLKKLSGK